MTYLVYDSLDTLKDLIKSVNNGSFNPNCHMPTAYTAAAYTDLMRFMGSKGYKLVKLMNKGGNKYIIMLGEESLIVIAPACEVV